ncbi:MAG: DUF4418 family protein [Anaerolineae bacterium]
MNKILGTVMIVLALVLAIAPIFTDCESQGGTLTTAQGKTVSMKCHWTGIAEVGAAVPLALAGVFAISGRRKESLRFAAIIGLAAAVVSLLLPTVLIGTCGNETMICNLAMKPILLAAGILAAVASVILFVSARDSESPAVVSE